MSEGSPLNRSSLSEEDRATLAEVVLNNGLCSVRDASAYTSGCGDSYLREAADDIADALAPVLAALLAAERERVFVDACCSNGCMEAPQDCIAQTILCHEGVTRAGNFEPCDRPAVAHRYDPETGGPYPVCIKHTRRDMVPLKDPA